MMSVLYNIAQSVDVLLFPGSQYSV